MERLRIGVLISGGGTNLQAIIDSADRGEINGEVVVVVSDKKTAYGLTRAEKHGIDNLYIGRGNYPEKEERQKALLDALRDKELDMVVLAGYLSIVPESVIEAFRNKIINVHPSLIPSYCGKGFYGMKVHEAVIENKEPYSGVTIHFVDEGTDTGPIIYQEKVVVAPGETPESLAEKIHVVEHRLLVKTVKEFCEGKPLVEGVNDRD